jgi:tetratricopeptide (TPR) repeat protein
VGVYQYLCDEYLRRNDLASAQDYSRRAITMQEHLVERFAGSLNARMDLSLCHHQSASVLAADRKYVEAVAALDRMIPMREELVRLDPADVLGKSWLAAAHVQRGDYLDSAGKTVEAASALETGLRQYYNLLDIEKSSQRFQTAVAETEATLARVYAKRSRNAMACELFRKASGRFRQLTAEAKSASPSPKTAQQVESALARCTE